MLGSGRPLSRSTRSYFEPRFGRDFGDVRIHTDASADRAARSVDAEAFTAGRDVAFASGNFEPGTRDGRRLLAHELAHVVQQDGAASRFPGFVQRQARTGAESSRERFPEHRRVEITVDPEPPTLVTIDPTPNEHLGERVPDRITNDYLIDYYLGMGDPEMQIALFTTAGDYADEQLREKLSGGFIPYGPAETVRSFIMNQVDDDDDGSDRFDEIVIENYVERTHWESRERLVGHHERRRRVQESRRKSPVTESRPRPEQTVYFEFDSTEFNERLTSQRNWEFVVGEVLEYVELVNTHLDETPYVYLEGHASEVGDEAYNRDLSKRRADGVRERLASELEGTAGRYVLRSFGVGESGS